MKNEFKNKKFNTYSKACLYASRYANENLNLIIDFKINRNNKLYYFVRKAKEIEITSTPLIVQNKGTKK